MSGLSFVLHVGKPIIYPYNGSNTGFQTKLQKSPLFSTVYAKSNVIFPVVPFHSVNLYFRLHFMALALKLQSKVASEPLHATLNMPLQLLTTWFSFDYCHLINGENAPQRFDLFCLMTSWLLALFVTFMYTWMFFPRFILNSFKWPFLSHSDHALCSNSSSPPLGKPRLMFLYAIVNIVNVFFVFFLFSRMYLDTWKVHFEIEWRMQSFLRFCFSFSKHYMGNTTTLPYQVSPVNPIPKLFPKNT